MKWFYFWDEGWMKNVHLNLSLPANVFLIMTPYYRSILKQMISRNKMYKPPISPVTSLHTKCLLLLIIIINLFKVIISHRVQWTVQKC